MASLALYREFRPTTFDEIIGQNHVTTTLKNQIKTGQVGHAYLFCGSRGTGKTSAAKVFAKALNCTDIKEGNPCLKCKNCTDLTGVDIIELDAASNNGVDYIRDIKEKASFSPINGKYKIYIVDEVHMLSVNAFNAFLKILEEPPAYAIFVLCTTEPQKIPQTILSRCMRFDFRLIGISDLVALLSDVLGKRGKKATPQAINAICAAGEGSVRDTLSIADRCISFVQDKTLEYDDVMSILGATDNTSVQNLVYAVLKGDISQILTLSQSFADAGKNLVSLAKDVALVLRNILVCQTVSTPQEILLLPQNRLDVLQGFAKEFSTKKVLYALNSFVAIENDLRFSVNPKILFESVALRVATTSGEVDMDSVQMRVNRLEKKLEELAKNPISEPMTVRQPLNSTQMQSPLSLQYDTVKTAAQEDDSRPQNVDTTSRSQSVNMQSGVALWGKIISALRSRGDEFLLPICENVDKIFVEDGVSLVVQVKSGAFAILKKSDNYENLQNLLSEISSLRLVVRILEDKDTWEQSLQQFKTLAGDAPLFVDGKKVN